MQTLQFQSVSDADLLKARLFNRARLTDGGCWQWTGGRGSGGYGSVSWVGQDRRAHRVAYEVFVGPIPTGLVLRHSCDNPGCINPGHLTPGAMKENAMDREARNRRDVKGEQIGTAKLTTTQIVEIKSSKAKLKTVALQYGVSESCVSSIRTGKAWAHLNAMAA